MKFRHNGLWLFFFADKSEKGNGRRWMGVVCEYNLKKSWVEGLKLYLIS